MKLKTIIIVLLIAAAAYIGYKWYSSKKENKTPDNSDNTEDVKFDEQKEKEYQQVKSHINTYFLNHRKIGNTPYLTTSYYEPEVLYLSFKENDEEGSEISIDSYKVYLQILNEYNVKIPEGIDRNRFKTE